MKKNAKQPTRIAIVDAYTDTCAVCGKTETGCHFDHDLAALNGGIGLIGYECAAFVIFGEDALRETAGICLPNGAPPEDQHSSIP